MNIGRGRRTLAAQASDGAGHPVTSPQSACARRFELLWMTCYDRVFHARGVSGACTLTQVPIVQRPRTWPFQGQNTGSNPVGDEPHRLRGRLSTLVPSRSGRHPAQWNHQGKLVNVVIPKSLQELIRQKISDGHYSNEEEVVADALRLMQARDAAVEIKRARLKDAIDRGYDDVADGKIVTLDTDDDIDAFFGDL